MILKNIKDLRNTMGIKYVAIWTLSSNLIINIIFNFNQKTDLITIVMLMSIHKISFDNIKDSKVVELEGKIESILRSNLK